VLLPSDIYRKLITSVTAVLLPFVVYLLTLPSIPTVYNINLEDYFKEIVEETTSAFSVIFIKLYFHYSSTQSLRKQTDINKFEN
jgi:hypothetical protein